jgi:hypothetical protein
MSQDDWSILIMAISSFIGGGICITIAHWWE